MRRAASHKIRLRLGDTGGAVVTVRGREAWALRTLMAAGERGCTPIDRPAPRWSGYVHELRKLGIMIETIRERHGGDFPGAHARYVLRSPIRVVCESETGPAKPRKPSVIVHRGADAGTSTLGCEKRTSGRKNGEAP